MIGIYDDKKGISVNKKIYLALAVLTLTGSAFAQNQVVSGEIVAVKPLYKTITVSEPVRECREVVVQDQQANDSVGGMLIGGIAGGIIGNQVGKGDGNKIATAIGAVVGSQVGRNMAESNTHAPSSHTETQCTQSSRSTQQRVISGYRYEYSTTYGNGFATADRLVSVGQTIRVRIAMKPEL